MITKEELLEKLLETRIGDKHRTILKLALKGLEYEKIEGQEFIPIEDHAKIVYGVRTYWESKHDDLVCKNRITVNNLRHEVDGLTRSRNFWRKKYDDLADELDDKIIALEDKLRDTVSLKYHDAIVDSANQKIVPLRQERDAFQRLVGELQTENNCMRADLENVCKELSVLKIEIEELETELGSKDDDWRLSVSYYMNLAAVWEKRAEETKAKLKKFEAFFTGED